MSNALPTREPRGRAYRPCISFALGIYKADEVSQTRALLRYGDAARWIPPLESSRYDHGLEEGLTTRFDDQLLSIIIIALYEDRRGRRYCPRNRSPPAGPIPGMTPGGQLAGGWDWEGP